MEVGRVAVFSARRLTVARCRRSLTKKGLAEKLNVSAQIVTAWEDETRKPSDDMAQRIAFAVGFPLSFLYGGDIDLFNAEDVTFRSRRSLTATARDKALATGMLATEVVSVDLRQRFRFPVIDIPDLSTESPESSARILREQWRLGLGPIHNMVHLLESKGVEVYWLNEPVPSLDAFSLWRDERPFIFLNMHKESGDRARFDAAHELGHLVMHRQESRVDSAQHEEQANQFASSFLLANESFARESPSIPILNQYLPLKRRWGVSVQAMIRRGKDLGIFSEWYYEQAMVQLSKAGWRADEPAKLPRETSLLHNMVFDSLAAKKIRPDEFARMLSLPYSDLADLMPNALIHVPIDRVDPSPPQPDWSDRPTELVLRIVE